MAGGADDEHDRQPGGNARCPDTVDDRHLREPSEAPDPKYAKVVQAALPTIKGPGDVVSLAVTLDDVAARTYTKNEPGRQLDHPVPDSFLGTRAAASPSLLMV